jgi:DNA-binding MarR family transcriptional regulator
MPKREFSAFGTRNQTQLLILLYLLSESFPRELARLLNVSLSAVQNTLDGLEKDGIIATRKLGVERRVQLNPAFFAVKELKALLERLAQAEPELQEAAASVRKRPRRRNKPLAVAPGELLT